MATVPKIITLIEQTWESSKGPYTDDELEFIRDFWGEESFFNRDDGTSRADSENS